MKLKIHYTKLITILLFLSFFNQSCFETENDDDEIADLDSVNYVLNQTRNIFYSLPSPLETIEIIKKTGIKYNESLLNPPEKLNNYSTNKSMAINLGIFGADLSYASLFEQRQTTLKYMATMKKLADNLGVLGAIEPKDLKRLEENINNKDSIMDIIADTFLGSDIYLNKNNRPEIAIMVSLGGWIESLYIAIKLSEKSQTINKELIDRILEQRLSLELVIKSLETYKYKEEVAVLIKDISQLQDIYKKIVVSKTKTVKDPETGVAKLKTVTEINLTDENFAELYDKVIEIRNSYTQM